MNKRNGWFLLLAFLAMGCSRVHYQVFEFEPVGRGKTPLRVEYDFWLPGQVKIVIKNPTDRPYELWLDHGAYQVDSTVFPMKGNGAVGDRLPLPRRTQTVLYLRDRWTPVLPNTLKRKEAAVTIPASEDFRRRLSFYYRVCPMEADDEACQWHADHFRLRRAYLVPAPLFEGRQHARREQGKTVMYASQPWKHPLRSYRYRKPPHYWLRTFVPTIVGVFGLIFISLAL